MIKHFPSATGGTVKDGIGIFRGAVVSGGSATAILTIYDGTGVDGRVLFVIRALAGATNILILPTDCQESFSNLFVALSGASSVASIIYE